MPESIFQKYNPAWVLATLMFICLPTLLTGQVEQPSEQLMKVRIAENHFFISADTSFFVASDTMIMIPGNLEYMISRYPPLNEAKTYRAIKRKVGSRKLLEPFYNLTFVDPGNDPGQKGGSVTESTDPFEMYKGMVIRDIRFVTLEPFGPSLRDTTGLPYSGIGKLGNAIHIKTRSYILRENLLISTGELLDPLTISDNELLIRSLSYIDDTRFVVVPVDGADSVDVVVITKDKFSFGISPIIKSFDNVSIKLWNENLYGLGHHIEGEASFITSRTPVARFEHGNYTIPNINGSFISGNLGYDLIDGRHRYSIGFSRGYLPPAITTGLGMQYARYSWTEAMMQQDSVYLDSDFDMEIQHVFFGHTFALQKQEHSLLHNIYLTPGLSMLKRHYLERPETDEALIDNYRNFTLFLANLSISRNNFYNSNYFYEFGRTENVPYGFKLNMLGGLEIGEYYNRFYSGFNISASDYIRGVGYLYAEIGSGGYYHEGRIEEGLIGCRFDYASQLFRIRHNKVRLFSSVSYIRGINRSGTDYIRFEGNNGIRGFSSDVLRGNQRLSFHIEPVVFTPWVVMGFRFVFFAYAAMGMIGSEENYILDKQIYSGFGLGVRIKNDNLVFNALELSVSVFPRSPSDQQNIRFDASGIPTPGFSNFLPSPPGILPYR
jgi:hypothetical protein